MRARHALTLAAAALLTARLATAQIIEVPTFTVGTPTFGSLIQDADVAVGTDGTMLFIWGEYNNRIETDNNALRHVSPAGSPLGPVLRGDTSAHVFDPVISSETDTRGGYVGAWQWIINGREYEFFGRGFDGNGTGIGSDFATTTASRDGRTSSAAASAASAGRSSSAPLRCGASPRARPISTTVARRPWMRQSPHTTARRRRHATASSPLHHRIGPR